MSDDLPTGSADASDVRIKICGITNADDARACTVAKVDFLGFNFYPRSPRYVTCQTACEIVEHLPETISRVGLFVNAAQAEVLSIVAAARLDAVQLHGDESPAYCEELRRELPDGFLIIKALRVGENFDPNEARRYAVGALLLDAYLPEIYGGTGHTFDWTLARRAREATPRLFLAGGLTPANVADAVRTVRPYAVDVCSSVEIAPGCKCHESIERLVSNARSALTAPQEVSI